MVRHEDDCGGLNDRACIKRHRRDELGEETPVRGVEAVVVLRHGTGQREIALHHGTEDLAHLLVADLRQARQAAVARQRRQVDEAARQPGDTRAVVAHALELAGHVQQAHDLAEIAGHRRLCEDRSVAELMSRALQIVEAHILLDDQRRHVRVALGERPHRAHRRERHPLTHLGDGLPQARQILGQRGAELRRRRRRWSAARHPKRPVM